VVQTAEEAFYGVGRILTITNYGTGHGVQFVEFKFMCGLVNNAGRHRLHLVNKRVDQRILAKQICDTRDATRILVNSFHGVW
jgi:hypothetical protein